jgi:hypothetical protein
LHAPAECPAEVELHLVVFLDDGPLAVLPLPRIAPRLFELHLKTVGHFPPIAVANPDVILSRFGNFDRLRHNRFVVIGGSGDRQKPTLATLAPFRRPSRARQTPMTGGLFHFRLTHRPAEAADASEMLGFNPEGFVSGMGGDCKQRNAANG